MRILKPGGTVFVGWQPTLEVKTDLHGAMDQLFMEGWKQCLEKAGDRLLFEVLVEKEFFGITEYGREQSYAVLVVKNPDGPADPA